MLEIFNDMSYVEIGKLFRERAREIYSDASPDKQDDYSMRMWEQYKLDERTNMIEGFRRNNGR